VGSMHAVKYLEIERLTDLRLKQKYAELDSLEPKYEMFREKYHLFDYEKQVEEVTEAYMRSLYKGTSGSNSQLLKAQYENLVQFGTDALITGLRYRDTRMIIDSMIETKIIAVAEATKDITYSHIVENPIPADKKSYPIRWFIVALSLISTLFAGLVIFLILDYQKQG
jgi:hypothetical protein